MINFEKSIFFLLWVDVVSFWSTQNVKHEFGADMQSLNKKVFCNMSKVNLP